MLTRDHSFTCDPHIYPKLKCTIHAFNSQPQSITALWLVFISYPAKGRQSWPGWLGEILRWSASPKMVIHPSVSQSGLQMNSQPSSSESNALTTRLPTTEPGYISHLELEFMTIGTLDCVLFHWAHFTVLRFIFVYVLLHACVEV